jgi:prepilin-type processing-associated H-X9-DG protein
VPKVRKSRPSRKVDRPKAAKSAGGAVATAPPPDDAGAGAAETIACMHCGHINPLPGGRRPGKTVSCKLCARMFSIEAAAAHVPPPPPEPPPPPPGMTPHAPDVDSIDAPKAGAELIYTPKLAPKKGLSRTFKLVFGLTVTIVLVACGIGAAVMVPYMVRTRAAAQRNECAINLRKIGGEIDRYCMENGGAYPESLARLLVANKMSEDLFVCPAGRETPAPGATAQARADHLVWARHLSYAYVGRGMNKRTGIGAGVTAVVAYERLSNHADGINVLFADGHVSFVPEPKASKLVADVQAGKNPPGVSGY